MVPSKFVRKHAPVPILPTSKQLNKIHYSFDLSIIQCYTSGRFYQNVLLYAVLYLFTTGLLYEVDPSLTKFIRGDFAALTHRNDIKQPAAVFQGEFEKLMYAILYHVCVLCTISISALSITGMPPPYNSSSSTFNHGLLFAFLLPLGKLLVEFKYRYNEMDFYGVFYDVFGTFFRIMFPLLLVTKMNQISSLISFFMFFDPSHTLPNWIVYIIVLVGILIIAMILRQIIPTRQLSHHTSKHPSDSQIESEEKTEKTIQNLINRAKSVL